jgi:hypothetical protein
MDSQRFRVRFAGRYAYRHHAPAISRALGGPALDCCSFWIERTPARVRVDRPEELDGVGGRHLARALARRVVTRLRMLGS